MYPPLLDMYGRTLQLEREKEVLRLLEDARLLREVKTTITSQPKINIKTLLTIFTKERVTQEKTISIRPTRNAVGTESAVQCQSC